jgi:hypothetical protein
MYTTCVHHFLASTSSLSIEEKRALSGTRVLSTLFSISEAHPLLVSMFQDRSFSLSP